MREFLLTMQYISIAGVFVETWIVAKNWKKPLHTYLFLSCIASLLNNFGYLLEMTSKTRDEYVVALKISYAGRVWFTLFLFLFITELTGKRLPEFLKNILMLLHTAIYGVIFFVGSGTLYYRKMQFATGGIFPKLNHENGIVYNVFMVMQVLYIIIGMAVLIITLKQQRESKQVRKRLVAIIRAVVIQAAFYALQMAGIGKLTSEYDITMLGFFIGTILMLYAIFRYDLLGMSEIARDFVVDRLSEGIFATDTQGMIKYYNEPMKTLFPEILSDPESVLRFVKKAADRDETINVNKRIYSPEENDLLYKGESIGTLYSLVDETEHFRYMAELEEQKALADQANKAKSSFLANMSHEIRTPINAVLGMDEMILRESRETQTKKYAADIMSAGKTLLSLINDILDLSKIEEGKMEIIPVQYELASIINDLLNMVKDRAEKKGLELKVDVDEKTPFLLYGDEIRIRQCALNLLTNAVKYTESGTVTLSVSFEKKDDENILLSFRITDTGIGIKEEDMKKLFETFTRIEEKRNRTIEGTGLGMNITQELLSLMGSKLDVKSEYGKGSEFSFTVEQKVSGWNEIGDYAGRFSEDSEHDYHVLFHASDAKILVVDDTEVNLSVIENLLKRTKIQVDTASSGKAALKLAEENVYDIILLDHMMPEMDGIETLAHLKESGKNTKTPTVALTANAVSGAREMYLEAGFTTYLSKPVDGEKLEKMLYDLLPENKIEMYEMGFDEAPIDFVPDKESTDNIPEWLFNVPGINVKDGVRFGGGQDGFMSILTVFYRTASANADEIEKLYDDNDIENYTIKVHALKSASRIVGAKEISELSKSLEDAGKKGDKAYIDEHTKELLDMYRSLEKDLSPLEPKDDKPESEKPELGPSEIKEAYQTIIEIAGSMDFDMMDGILKDLDNYRLPEKDEKLLKEIKALCLDMNWDEIKVKVQEAISNG